MGDGYDDYDYQVIELLLQDFMSGLILNDL